eukprot:GHVN01056436.1.p1 GENE.GHVN01056436.1~~GHVN01056436.1.p1  ORF type:complete len:472 (-),score=61.13 GHVN01056436.1:942-2357(-)
MVKYQRSLIVGCVALICARLLSFPRISSIHGVASPYEGAEVHPSDERKSHSPPVELTSVEVGLEELSEKVKRDVQRILYGDCRRPREIPPAVEGSAFEHSFEVKHETLFTTGVRGEDEQVLRPVRVGVIQNSIVLPTTASPSEQYKAIQAKVEHIIDAAGQMGVNVLSLQEAWTMPFAFCTREKRPWMQFAEPADERGESTQLIIRKAKQWGMVIVSPILERDVDRQGVIWNTVVLVNNRGEVLGKHRKNHIPRVGDFNEASYYLEGDTGHPVFETDFGRIGVNICYGRHHPMNWMGFAMNGAEIIFNPSATVSGLSEHLWPIEARNAAVANNVFTAAINRVGTETFPNEFTSGNGEPAHHDFGHFYGSSYISGPSGCRTGGLSRLKDGLLVTDIDLADIEAVRDQWMFQATARYPMYQNLLSNYISHDFKPSVVKQLSKYQANSGGDYRRSDGNGKCQIEEGDGAMCSIK